MFYQVTKCRGFDQLLPIQSTRGKSIDVFIGLLCASVVTVYRLTLLVSFESHIHQHNKMKKSRRTNIVNMWSKTILGPPGMLHILDRKSNKQ